MKKGGALLRCKRVNAVTKFQTKKRREIKEGALHEPLYGALLVMEGPLSVYKETNPPLS
jgi:hypothetical protein